MGMKTLNRTENGPSQFANIDRLPFGSGVFDAEIAGRAAGVDFPASTRDGATWPRHAVDDHRIPDNDTVLKHVFDRVFAALALVLLSPLFLMVVLLIRFTDPGPIFFAHERIGKRGQRFKCLKFRTMAEDGDAILAQHLRDNPDAAAEWNSTRKLQDDPRVTRLGDALRRSSIDELPQLWNILVGDMSVVGPRPIVDAEIPHYGNAIFDYLSVRPGLTGLWQVSGRSDVGYGQRVRLDTEYVRTRTILKDAAIVLKTIKVVAFREGSC